jgi:hypothetical protein
MADEILNEAAAKEAALKENLKREELAEKEFKLDEGLLSEEELADLAKKLEEKNKKEEERRREELKKAEEELRTIETLVNESSLPSMLYTSSKIQLSDATAKAAELTAFIEALLRPGIFTSVSEAYDDGVPVGTFIIVDDPNTDETEFKIEVVTEPFTIDGDETPEVAEPVSPEA